MKAGDLAVSIALNTPELRQFLELIEIARQQEMEVMRMTATRFQFQRQFAQDVASEEPAINGFDRGDLLADIDRQCGDVIERAIHRYLPREAAKGMRRGIIGQLGDAIVRFDELQHAVSSTTPEKAAG